MRKMFLVSLMICVLLSGCTVCVSHDWVAEACDSPKTCSKCGKTSGSAPGHNWQEAECENPKTCSTCGAVEGEPLGHTEVAAEAEEVPTLGNPVLVNAVCSRCGIVYEVREIAKRPEVIEEKTFNFTEPELLAYLRKQFGEERDILENVEDGSGFGLDSAIQVHIFADDNNMPTFLAMGKNGSRKVNAIVLIYTESDCSAVCSMTAKMANMLFPEIDRQECSAALEETTEYIYNDLVVRCYLGPGQIYMGSLIPRMSEF